VDSFCQIICDEVDLITKTNPVLEQLGNILFVFFLVYTIVSLYLLLLLLVGWLRLLLLTPILVDLQLFIFFWLLNLFWLLRSGFYSCNILDICVDFLSKSRGTIFTGRVCSDTELTMLKQCRYRGQIYELLVSFEYHLWEFWELFVLD